MILNKIERGVLMLRAIAATYNAYVYSKHTFLGTDSNNNGDGWCEKRLPNVMYYICFIPGWACEVYKSKM